ncbi:ADP-ribosylglycohydrolase family protein [Pseudorhodobacter wandonensis]|uniref:ADP-ribosylglycohydrolase family protein n=1 Tax=Pseudorhodobacter wandonensis TaxID=1120568 RepID=UPI00067BC8E1|nr:ADP-ribosylglycohydrolase family protein [Pseudorhodobacter wandonensis]
MLRDSTTDPLRIDSLPIGNGLLGLTLCPGKKGDSVNGGAWDRDLDVDLDVIKAWGATAVLSLIEDHEFDLLSVSGLSDAAKSRGMDWYHFPIRDLDVPTPEAMEAWRHLSPRLHKTLENGGRVLVHCRGGLGRAGTVAALLLVERGCSATQAMANVRAARPGAIETQVQERLVVAHGRHEELRFIRLHASLLGGAIGDSLGAEIEFLSLAEIRHRYPSGIKDLLPHMGLRGAITDDTQMTLFTAEGIIRALIRSVQKGICNPPSVIHHALLRWYKTQGGKPKVQTDDVGLIEDPRLWVCRAPGNTCLSSLGASAYFGDAARNSSKGCGTIMRVVPVALMFPRDQVRRMAIDTSALTHGHVTGQLAAAAWAEMLADVAAGAALEESATRTAEMYAQLDGGEETVQAIQAALAAPRDGAGETVESLGGGWTAEEALSIALYACLTGNSFEEALAIAVTHGGDSDSTGAITGNMLGLLDPAAVLRHRWPEIVEGSDLVTRLVRDFRRLSSDIDAAEELFQYYPGG